MDQWRVELKNWYTGEFYSFPTFAESQYEAEDQALRMMGSDWRIYQVTRVTGGVG